VNIDSVLMGILEGLGAQPILFGIVEKKFIALQAKQIFRKMPDET
jgi:hypothetical protein